MIKRIALFAAVFDLWTAYASAQVALPGQSGGLCNFGTTCMLDSGLYNPQGVYVLDQLSSYPAVDYSVRQMTSGQYLPAYDWTVRRSSDNATANIGFSGGLVNGTQLALFCSGTNAYLVTWKDQGSLGSSADATQATAANQPQVCASGAVVSQNGRPAVSFSTTQTLSSAAFTGAANFTATGIFVVQTIGTSGAVNLLQNGASNPALFFLSFVLGNKFGSFDATNTVSTVNPTAGAGYILTNVRPTSGTYQAYINGSAAQTSSASATNITALGFQSPNSSGYIYSVQEALGFQVLQSASDRTVYDLNAAAFYGISGVTQ